jgi:chromosome segregation ATPase
MSRVITALLTLSFLLYGASIESQIRKKNQELSSNKKQYNRMDNKLSSVAKKIILAKAEWSRLDKKLAKLEKSIKEHSLKFNELSHKKRAVDEHILNLSSEIRQKREKFICFKR